MPKNVEIQAFSFGELSTEAKMKAFSAYCENYCWDWYVCPLVDIKQDLEILCFSDIEDVYFDIERAGHFHFAARYAYKKGGDVPPYLKDAQRRLAALQKRYFYSLEANVDGVFAECHCHSGQCSVDAHMEMEIILDKIAWVCLGVLRDAHEYAHSHHSAEEFYDANDFIFTEQWIAL